MKRMLAVSIGAILAGCTAVAIIPAKITYTYPFSDDLACYPQAGRGAVAVQDNETLRLALPDFSAEQRLAKAFVFDKVTRDGVVWTSSDDPDFRARFVQAPEKGRCSTGRTFDLPLGLLLVEFPANETRYGALAGKHIWLASTAGKDEIFVVRGIYYKSSAGLEDRVGRHF